MAIEATNLFSKVLERYAAISSYEDHGFVKVDIGEGFEPDVVSFATLFERPGKFRMDFRRKRPKFEEEVGFSAYYRFFLVDGKSYLTTQFNDQKPQSEELPDERKGVASVHGISYGAASRILMLFNPELIVSTLDKFLDPSVLSCQIIDGTECEVVSARHRGIRGMIKLYFESSTYLLRRYEASESEYPTLEVRSSIGVDGKISKDLFSPFSRQSLIDSVSGGPGAGQF